MQKQDKRAQRIKNLHENVGGTRVGGKVELGGREGVEGGEDITGGGREEIICRNWVERRGKKSYLDVKEME